MAPRE